MPSTIHFPEGSFPPGYFTANRSEVLLGVTATFIVLEVLVFGLRLLARKLQGAEFGWDDALVLLALVFNLGQCIEILLCLQDGLGRHTLAAIREDPSWPARRYPHLASLTLIAIPVTYLFAVALSKLAILILFRKIFKFGIMRYMVYLIGAVTIVHCIVATTGTLMQCIPLSVAWSSMVRETCIDVTKAIKIGSYPNVATDIIMLVMPLPEVWRLNISKKVKLGISITLLTASIGVLASTIRMVTLIRTNISADPLWYNVDPLALSIAEPGTLFIACCLVTFRILLKRLRVNTRFARSRSIDQADYSPRSRGKPARTELASGNRQAPRIPKKKEARGFVSILLSAVSNGSQSQTESTVDITLEDSHPPTSDVRDNSAV